MNREKLSSSLSSAEVISLSSFVPNMKKEEKELERDDDYKDDDDEENRQWIGFFENMTYNNLDAEDDGKDDDDDDDQDQDNNDNYGNKGLLAGRSLSYSIIKTEEEEEEEEEAPDSIPSNGNMCVEDDNFSRINSINNTNTLVWGDGTKTTGLLANAAVQQQQPQQEQANTTIDCSIIPDNTTTRGNISDSTSDKFSTITGRKRKGEYDASDGDNKKATNETILYKDNDDNGADDTDHDYEDVDEDDGETLASSSSQKKKMRHSNNYVTNNIPKADSNSNDNNKAVQQQQPQQEQANTTIDCSIIPDVTTTRGNISDSTSDKFSTITGRKRKGEYDATDDDNKKATNETILYKDNDDNGADDTDHDFEDVDEDDGETLASSSSQKKKMRHSNNYGTNNIPKADSNSDDNNKAVIRIFEQEEENEEWHAYSQQQQGKYNRIAMGNECNDLTAQQIIIEYPNQSDIISGQGKCIMYHPGNVFFRTLVDAKLDEYIKLKSQNDVVRFTLHIVYLLKEKYGARFLKKGTIESNNKSDYWIEIPDEHARSKVRVCFRDKIKQQQQQHKQQQQQQLIYQQQQYIQHQQQQHKAELEAKIEKQKRRKKNKQGYQQHLQQGYQQHLQQGYQQHLQQLQQQQRR